MAGLSSIFGGGEPPIVPRSGWSAWLVSISAAAMAFLAVVTIAAGIAAVDLGLQWQSELEGAATIRMAAGDPGALERVMELLAGTEGVAGARPLDRAAQTALLAPWLGDGAALSELPIPQLIDVRLEGGGPDRRVLIAALERVAPGSVYDDHSAWRGPLLDAAGALRTFAFAAAFLVLLGACGIVALAARASLAGNREIVRVIRLIGGTDGFIEAAFVRPLVLRAGIGALPGAALAVAALATLPDLGATVGLDLAPDWPRLALLGVGVPLAIALVGWATARLSVRMALRALP